MAGPSFAADLQWSSIAALPSASAGRGAFVAVIDGKLVVAGGMLRPTEVEGTFAQPASAEAWVLDAPDARWRSTTPLPMALAFGGAASFGDFAVFAGGLGERSGPFRADAYKVSFRNGDLAYDPLPPMPEARAFGGGAAVDGDFYLVCGGTGIDIPTRTALRLEFAAEGATWTTSPPIPGGPRLAPSAVGLDGALYVLGGTESIDPEADWAGVGPLLDSYVHTPDQGWKRIADLPTGVGFATTVQLGPTHIAAIGGVAGAAPDAQEQVRPVNAYHTITDTWVDAGQFPSGATAPRPAYWDDSIVVVGGDPDPGATESLVLAASLHSEPAGFSSLDYATLTAYFCALVMMGIYFAGKGSSTEEFFLAGRRMPWWATGLSIFGTQLSSISFMAIPAKVYATDWVYFVLQMTIIMVAFPVVFLYLPKFRQIRMTSAYEYLERRFSLPVRMYASLSFVLYQVGRMAIVLFLPAIALSTVTGFSVYSCILVMGVLSTAYTVMGGMKAVIWTDVVQVFVLYGGALLSLGILMWNMDGGLAGIVAEGMQYDKFHMFNWTWDWTTTAVWVVVVGNLFMNLVPYTSDQAVVQRYFTTKDEKAAAKSIWTNAILILPSTLTLFLLGTGLWAFYRANPALLDPALPTDSIFPLFIAQQLPAGIAGILIAAVFAASMSTLDSSLNSVSTALVTDFYARFRPDSSDRIRLRLARYLTGALGALATSTSIALATFDIGSLWDTFQGMMGLLGGGLAGLFALGIFFPRANGRGAMVGAAASVIVLYWVQQHTDLHFFLYGAVGILTCVGIGLASSQVLRSSAA